MNIATILPLKNPEWTTQIFDYLPDSWNKHITSTTKNEKYIYIYEKFDWDMTDEEIKKEEEFIDLPFNLILSSYKKEFNRKNYVYVANLTRFWRTFFKENKIDIFLGRMEAYTNDFISTRVAKKMGIKFISYGSKFLTNALLLDEHGNPILWKEPTKKDIDDGVKFFEEHSQGFNTFIKKYNAAKSKDYSSFLNDIYEKLTLSKERKYEATSIIRSLSKQIKGRINKLFIKTLYDKMPEDYIYYVLHYKYETYLYREFWYLDQYDLLYQTAKCIPQKYNLVFRTHPAYGGSDADFKKIKEMKKMRNIKFIPLDVYSGELIRNSKTIVGIFSTALLEAIILGKPSIVLFDKGYYVEGVNLYINDLRDLPEAIRKITSGEFKVDEEKRKYYLGKLYKHFIPFEGEITSLGPMPTKESSNKIAKQIISYLSYID